MTLHQYEIFTLVPQTSFRGKTSAGGIATDVGCFLQASWNVDIRVSSGEVAGQTLISLFRCSCPAEQANITFNLRIT